MQRNNQGKELNEFDYSPVKASGADAEIRRFTRPTYMTDQTAVKTLEPHEALPFWGSRHTTYPRLASLAEDLIGNCSTSQSGLC